MTTTSTNTVIGSGGWYVDDRFTTDCRNVLSIRVYIIIVAAKPPGRATQQVEPTSPSPLPAAAAGEGGPLEAPTEESRKKWCLFALMLVALQSMIYMIIV